MRKKILLIGSCGFLLSNFLRKNLFHKQQEHFYIGLDNLSEKHSFYNRYQHHLYKQYIGDVLDINFLYTLFKLEKPDIIIFGANSSKEELYWQTKLGGISNLINISYSFNIEKLIYLSSTNIYGNVADSLSEFSNVNPTNYNSAIDYAVENLLKEKASKFEYNIVRPSCIYGQRANINDWIPNCLYKVYSDKLVFLNNHGSNEYDYLYIDDFCQGLNLIIESGLKNEVYNLSSGESISEIEIMNEIYKQMNKDISSLKFIKENINIDFCKISNSKLKKLGWSPNLKWRQNLQDTIAWYNTNKWMYKLYE